MRQPFDPRRRRLLAAGAACTLAACAPGAMHSGAQRRTGFAEVNGTRLYYETAGSGEPVVLIHAFMLDTRAWDDQFDVLARDFRVIRYDARGFGKSGVPTAGAAYSHVEDLAALLQLLDAPRPHLVGLSMGGRFALDYAVTRPEGMRSVAVIDPVVSGWRWSQEWFVSYAPIVEAGKRGDIAAAKRLWLAHELFASARANPEVGARLKTMVDDYSGWHLVHVNTERQVVPPTLTQLGSIKVPALVIVGDRDLPEFQRIAVAVETGVPNGKRVGIADAGHLANMEAPEPVTRTLRAFLLTG